MRFLKSFNEKSSTVTNCESKQSSSGYILIAALNKWKLHQRCVAGAPAVRPMPAFATGITCHRLPSSSHSAIGCRNSSRLVLTRECKSRREL